MYDTARFDDPIVLFFPWVNASQTSVVTPPQGSLHEMLAELSRTFAPPSRPANTTYAVRNIEAAHYATLLHRGAEIHEQEVVGSPHGDLLPPNWERHALSPQALEILSLQGLHTPGISPSPLREFVVCLVMDLRDATKGPQPSESELRQPRMEAREWPLERDRIDAREVVRTMIETFGLTYDELARMTRIGRTTFFLWDRTGARPRPSTLNRLLRVYSLARAVIDKLGPMEAATWLRAGSPSPLALLLARDFEAAEDAVASLVFSDLPAQRPAHSAFAPDVDLDIEVPAPASPTRVVSDIEHVVKHSPR